MCAGRHNDKNGCPQPYLKAAQAEDAVARYYGATIRHSGERVAKLEEEILVGLAAVSASRERELTRHGRRVEALLAERQKLLKLHYAERIDAEFFGEEQARIGKEMTAAKKELAKAELRVEQLKAALNEALRLATDSEYAYRVADDQTRRGWNQDFFKRIYIRDEEVVGAELTDTYAALLSEELIVKLEAFKADRQSKPEAKVTSLRTWGSIEGLIVETAGIEPASAIAWRRRLRAYPAL
jgi:hypothetical protein